MRDQIISDYSAYVKGFISIQDSRIALEVENAVAGERLWPSPLVQMNPNFEPGDYVENLVSQGILHDECKRIFRRKSEENSTGRELLLHRHQVDALTLDSDRKDYVLTTGTGSGKSLCYIVPIVNTILREGSGKGIRAVIVYPMNALANSQRNELNKYINYGYPNGKGPVSFAAYTGQEDDQKRAEILSNPPDILLTNYVMLEYILTRPGERQLVAALKTLRYLVLDEIHTYRGRQGADVAMLVRRVKQTIGWRDIRCIGTSATLTSQTDTSPVERAASQILGTEITSAQIVRETVRRATEEPDLDDQEYRKSLIEAIHSTAPVPLEYEEFNRYPLARWIESEFGVTRDGISGALVRAVPATVKDKAEELAKYTGIDSSKCTEAIQKVLLESYNTSPNPKTGVPPFAFRLHQFISRGDTVYATLQPEAERQITLDAQRFVPNDHTMMYMPLAFCRECGQEYYTVYLHKESSSPHDDFTPRKYQDTPKGDDPRAGYLFISNTSPWPEAGEELINRLPDDWLEETNDGMRVKRAMVARLPLKVRVNGRGSILQPDDEGGTTAWWLPGPFRFCMCCGVDYGNRVKGEYAVLAVLSTEGRSTATTVLSVNTIDYLRRKSELAPGAQKLLSFTDNRQDASLQAGHFNDFVEISLLRSALYHAAKDAPKGLRYDELAQKVFAQLNLAKESYAANPKVKYGALEETEFALQGLLGYRLYADMRRGWRVNAPNLEQCDLLKIDYRSLDDVCADEAEWQDCPSVLVAAAPRERAEVARAVLDFMRRELIINVDYLKREFQDQLKQKSSQYLRDPWKIAERETLRVAPALIPASKSQRQRARGDFDRDLYQGPRSSLVRYLARRDTFSARSTSARADEGLGILRKLLQVLTLAGIMTEFPPAEGQDVPAYQIAASCMVWMVGEGKSPNYDRVRMTRPPKQGIKVNPFFAKLYSESALHLRDFRASEHTAQVPTTKRQEREQEFRDGVLPVLYCSPTMELGVDIADLNVVNMRNVPPTPANYAQRSGRAGRSGQPALVITYCTAGSAHDQYFFNNQSAMVSGAVPPPRMDMANEDLIRAHMYAVWLAAPGTGGSRIKLEGSIKTLFDLENASEGRTPVAESLVDSLRDTDRRHNARIAGKEVMDRLGPEIAEAPWFTKEWLGEVIDQVERRFIDALDRWKQLYLAARLQYDKQSKRAVDASLNAEAKQRAQRLRREAEVQIEILLQENGERLSQSDFYPYRYFASEGFLPGYSFPRLPLSAFIPASVQRQSDDYLSRPRFLAISEFGPGAFIYHEGAKYQIKSVILPVHERGDDTDMFGARVKLCPACGYMHPEGNDDRYDVCELCGEALEDPLKGVFRMQNGIAAPRERISCDEEERQRQGYDLVSGLRFARYESGVARKTAELRSADGTLLGCLTYGHAATIWRINRGWSNRKPETPPGFLMDTLNGTWSKNGSSESQYGDEENEDDTFSTARTRRVIPYAEDRRNALLIQFEDAFLQRCIELEQDEKLEDIMRTWPKKRQSVMATLQAAIKRAIQLKFQLEDNELAAEALPDRDNRNLVLLYESAEGGAGVLRRLVDEPDSMANVTTTALHLCHVQPETGDDNQEDAPCGAACYRCLLSYMNQRDHDLLNRRMIVPLLMELQHCIGVVGAGGKTRAQQLKALQDACQTGLERRWLHVLNEQGYNLPSHAQHIIDSCSTQPDFSYETEGRKCAVYLDGPVHDFKDRQANDALVTERLEDAGWLVIRFTADEKSWVAKFGQFASVFGRTS